MRAAEQRAERLLAASLADTSGRERRSSRRLARLLADDAGRDFLLDLTDRVLRIRAPRRSAIALHDLAAPGVPASLGPVDRVGMRLLAAVAPWAPRTAQRLVDWRINKDTRGVILPAEDPAFTSYMDQRARDGFSLNVNVLGESILSDAEAEARTLTVLDRIARPDVPYVSVKISAVCANLDILAEADSLARIEAQLRRVYRASMTSTPRTFVNLDMEEYRDLELSLMSFMAVLDEPEFLDYEAGIVLQAYVPDSHAALERLCRWANARRARGGAGIKVRLVKGANLAMESVEAELHEWEPAPYPTKADVDASYKAMLDTALELGEPGAVRLGVASHNLFDVAWALTLRDELDDPSRVEIEMLEGMAAPQSRAVLRDAGSLLLYSPVVTREEREASIAYLSRRLDENSAPENFLRALFDLTPGSPEWIEQRDRFRTSVRGRHAVPTASRRTQNRSLSPAPVSADAPFHNSADTDFTQTANRGWIAQHLCAPAPSEVPLVDTCDGVDAVVARALVAQSQWAGSTWERRRQVLAAVARVMEDDRGRTLAVMAHTVGKTVREGDPEVSEAVDFASYAAHLTRRHENLIAAGGAWTPHRVVTVAGPWNFPYAIPACGLVHAIAAGASVILKPAPEARAVGALLVEQLLSAGVPEGLVQLACTPDNEVGRRLITHEDVDVVVLTGSMETARMFLDWDPTLCLHAETSGKNSVVITAAADVNQAIKDTIKSAFGHAGQKCSAASLAIVEASVYDDPTFHVRLADAARSLVVGRATDLGTVMGPLIAEPRGNLARALTTLEPGESWLLEPREISPTTWTPGIRRDVRPGSWFHVTECFGPVLGVMRADDLDHAIELQNAPEYGLTGGIQSLDAAEVATWLDRVEVGNAYVNRHITGAIVQRQPFGGWKSSSVGAGCKPGGPHHLDGYGTWTGSADVATAPGDFARSWHGRFGTSIDATGLSCERNVLRYRPLDRVIVRAARLDDATAIARAAAGTCGVPVEMSTPETESDQALAQRLHAVTGSVRLRVLMETSPDLLAAAHRAGVTVDRAPVTGLGDIELPHWLKEQAVSESTHRYGRLLRSAGDITG